VRRSEAIAGSEALSKGPLERAERARREKFEKIFQAKADDDGGDDVAKADRDHRVGHHSLAAAVVDHALDALDRHRKLRGYEKSATKERTTPGWGIVTVR
jgi:hypothetical protein